MNLVARLLQWIGVPAQYDPSVASPRVYPRVQVEELLKARLPGAGLIFRDERYWVPTQAEFLAIVKQSSVPFRRYQGDRSDCDDYAERLRTDASWDYGVNAVAEIDDGREQHDYNLVVVHDAAGALDLYGYDPTKGTAHAVPASGSGLWILL